MATYEPREDSHLLEKQVRINAFGRVLDLGTGSGIQALAALSNHDVGEVVAVDIDKEAVDQLRDKIRQQKLRKISVVQSDLFEQVEGKFNTIIFNPPYLPQDKIAKKIIEDRAIYGGTKGWELSELFFSQVSKYLAPEGKILFLFSTLTNKERIQEFMANNLLQFRELDQQKISFEILYVYEITKTSLLRELEAQLLEEVHFFAQGKRGTIYTAVQDRSKLIKTHFPNKRDLVKVAVKVKREDSEAVGRIQNEAHWLKILNHQGIGPRLLFSREKYLIYLFVEGQYILDWIKGSDKAEIKKVITRILEQCYLLDQLGLNKEEMHHPLKHIIITTENKLVLIDFERCSRTLKPKNVTQFIEFICRMELELAARGLKIDRLKLQELAGEYKDTRDNQILDGVVDSFR